MYSAAMQNLITQALKVIPISALLWMFIAELAPGVHCTKPQNYIFVLLRNLWEKPQAAYHPVSLFILFSPLSPLPGCRSHPPSLSLPDSPSVQCQGTGSRHWLDFHTVPSTECHITLIRVNNCSGALLSRAPISLVWPGSGDADGLVISAL